MSRARPGGLALVSVGLAIAAIIGVQLGRSAISEINPIHFQGGLERPQGITPPPEPAPFDPYAQSYNWSLPPPLPLDCGADCDTAQFERAAQFALDASAGRDPTLPPWRDATPTTQLRPWAPGDTPGGAQLERYMRYPVNREQAERAAAAEQAPAQAAARPEAQATAAPALAEALRPTAVLAEPAAQE